MSFVYFIVSQLHSFIIFRFFYHIKNSLQKEGCRYLLRK
ncbi:hypothetical protein BCBMB205_09540 [Bacillus sp. CN2]|nr:hypothetical protein BCBMB205_09540 [Bacillus velezensis]ARZ57284.1 hypothetical protein BAGQ_1049 [Bacillus velezensis]GFR54253.1 hypothetical protein BCBMB205_09540 [Bacillus sp. CN2]